MRIICRPLINGESDPELLWGSLLLVTALLGALWISLGLPTPLCALHALSGIPCPTCGTTRAAGALLHGEIKTAFVLNPLMTAALLGAGLYVCYAAVVVIGRLPRLRLEALTKTEANLVRIAAIGLLAANWLYLIGR